MSIPVQFAVSGLLGASETYTVTFPSEEEFHLVYGPNGVGKTKYLEAIDALCRLNVARLTAMPVDSVEIRYADGSHIKFVHSRETDVVRLYWTRADGVVRTMEMNAEAAISTQTLRAGGVEWMPVRPGVWRDPQDGETITEDELYMRYGNVSAPPHPEFEGFEEYPATQQTLFIKTGRLLDYTETRRRRPAYMMRGQQARTTAARYAEDIRGHLSDALTNNSRKSAGLDRTFPSRLLTEANLPALNEQDIRNRYRNQNAKRERLSRLSLIGAAPDMALPDRPLADWETRVLQMYLDDTEAKLETFNEVLEKVELLEDILNRRFLGKRVAITADEGLIIETDRGNRVEPAALSSGEQHELIMFYDMLFNVTAGSLVLIDEPEISLHVSWQRAFLEDMRRVCQLSSARVLIATHSPQIMGKWHTRATSISPYRDWDDEED